MTRHRRLELAAAVTVPATALTALIAACVMDGVVPVICSSGVVCPPNWKCVGEGQSCEPAACGDKYRDWANGEVCDDGNTVSGDGCSANCLSLELCGNGQVDPGEDCDPMHEESAAGCNPKNCRRTPMCGNGAVDPGEECDDGANGTRRATARCDEDCTRALCGDRVVNEHVMNAAGQAEECDEGGINTATCDADCTAPFCGDGVHNTADGEQCETRENTRECDADCTLPACGDEVVNAAAGEQCETTSDSADCDAKDCTFSVCGDGVYNAAAGEDCDDGNHRNDDDCVQGCELAKCGDGHRRAGVEDCDDGTEDSDTCDAHDCTFPVCGDNYINATAGEECDEAPFGNSDNCPNGFGGTCHWASCGDGFVHDEDGGTEQCDDGNRSDFDDCPSGSEPAGSQRCQPARCGDGFLRSGVEQCDPGANDSETCNGQGAPESAACRFTECGDGHLNRAAGEGCDPMDMDDADRCPIGLECFGPTDPNPCQCA